MILFRVFGVHLSVLQGAGIVSAAIMTTAVFLLARRFLGRIPSVAMAVTFLYAFGFAHLTPNPSFNFVLPYSYAATYGIIAATLGLLFLVRHAQEGRDRYLALSIVGLVLAALAKVEAVLPIAAAHFVYLIATVFMRRITRNHILFYLAGAVVLALPYGLLTVHAGARLWTDNLAVVVNQGNLSFALETMGFDSPLDSLQRLALSSIIMSIVVGGGVIASFVLRRDRSALTRWLVTMLPAVFGFFIYATLGTDLPLRLLPLLTIIFLVTFAWRFWRRPASRTEILPTLIIWSFTAGCLIRLGFNVGPFFYGFFLVPVPFVSLGVFLFRDLPALLGRTAWSKRAINATGFGLVAGFASAALITSTVFYAQHTMDIETPRGHIILRGEFWQKEVISYLQEFRSDTDVAVIPQGAGLLFLAGVQMAGGLYNYVPMEFSGSYTDENIVLRMQSQPPDIIVLLTQEPGSFRYTGFGIEFGHLTANWIKINYLPIAGRREVTILRHVSSGDTS